MADNPFGNFGGLGEFGNAAGSMAGKQKKVKFSKKQRAMIKAEVKATKKMFKDAAKRVAAGGGGARHRPAGSSSGGQFF